MKEKKFTKLCVKDITGNITGAEQDVLNKWLNQSVENKNEYEKIKLVWQNTAPKSAANIPDIDNEWMALSERLNLSGEVRKKETIFEKLGYLLQFVFTSRFKPVGAAVLIVILALTGVYFLQLMQSGLPEYKFTEITTDNGVRENVILPDGSTVVMNSASTVKYTEPFKENIREVYLEGEAFFSVKKDESPFVIKTNNAKVTVLGTEFNVWSREEKTKVFVKNGKVNLSHPVEEAKSVVLLKNELSTIVEDNDPLQPSIVDSEFLLGWMKGDLVFNKTSLREITGELERFYNIPFVLEDPSLNSLTLTGSFKNNDPDTVLSMICLALNIDYKKEQNRYIIKK